MTNPYDQLRPEDLDPGILPEGVSASEARIEALKVEFEKMTAPLVADCESCVEMADKPGSGITSEPDVSYLPAPRQVGRFSFVMSRLIGGKSYAEAEIPQRVCRLSSIEDNRYGPPLRVQPLVHFERQEDGTKVFTRYALEISEMTDRGIPNCPHGTRYECRQAFKF